MAIASLTGGCMARAHICTDIRTKIAELKKLLFLAPIKPQARILFNNGTMKEGANRFRLLLDNNASSG
jgi:hypothetical protein